MSLISICEKTLSGWGIPVKQIRHSANRAYDSVKKCSSDVSQRFQTVGEKIIASTGNSIEATPLNKMRVGYSLFILSTAIALIGIGWAHQIVWRGLLFASPLLIAWKVTLSFTEKTGKVQSFVHKWFSSSSLVQTLKKREPYLSAAFTQLLGQGWVKDNQFQVKKAVQEVAFIVLGSMIWSHFVKVVLGSLLYMGVATAFTLNMCVMVFFLLSFNEPLDLWAILQQKTSAFFCKNAT